MNKHIREVARAKMQRENKTQEGLEEPLQMRQASISRLLTGASGAVPKAWGKLLKELGLELIAVDAEDVEDIKAQQLAKKAKGGSSNG